MKQFMDIFSLPEMTLLSCVNEYFLKNNIDYEPVHLYKDVKVSVLAEITDTYTTGVFTAVKKLEPSVSPLVKSLLRNQFYLVGCRGFVLSGTLLTGDWEEGLDSRDSFL